jgi:hypothetical protein
MWLDAMFPARDSDKMFNIKGHLDREVEVETKGRQ